MYLLNLKCPHFFKRSAKVIIIFKSQVSEFTEIKHYAFLL